MKWVNPPSEMRPMRSSSNFPEEIKNSQHPEHSDEYPSQVKASLWNQAEEERGKAGRRKKRKTSRTRGRGGSRGAIPGRRCSILHPADMLLLVGSPSYIVRPIDFQNQTEDAAQYPIKQKL